MIESVLNRGVASFQGWIYSILDILKCPVRRVLMDGWTILKCPEYRVDGVLIAGWTILKCPDTGWMVS